MPHIDAKTVTKLGNCITLINIPLMGYEVCYLL